MSKKNVAHSIFQRLLKRAKTNKEISIFCSPVTAWNDLIQAKTVEWNKGQIHV